LIAADHSRFDGLSGLGRSSKLRSTVGKERGRSAKAAVF
jgi:hypothetical protein